MVVAVMADSHDNQFAIRAACALCKARSVSAIIHCGDIIAPFSIRRLVETGIPVYAVFGNNDGERTVLRRELPSIADPPLQIQLASRRIAVFHAPPEEFPQVDAVFYGHTHKKEARFERHTFILNPGELGGWLTGSCSMALVDLRTFEVEWIEF